MEDDVKIECPDCGQIFSYFESCGGIGQIICPYCDSCLLDED